MEDELDVSIAAERGGSYAHPTEPEIGKLMKTDPLLAAEQITGQSYKEDEGTSNLGFALAMQHNKVKENALRAARDTHYNIGLEDYIAIVEELGFKLVLKREFPNYRDYPMPLHQFVYVHPDGVVLDFTSWWTTHPTPHYKINGGSFYYNWKPGSWYWDAIEAARAQDDMSLDPPHITSSGGYENVNGHPPVIDNPDYDPRYDYGGDLYDPSLDYEDRPIQSKKRIDNPEWKTEDLVYCGYHDAREGLRYHFEMLRNWGEFCNPWIKLPFGSCFNLLAFDEAQAYYDINRVDHGTAMSWPVKKRQAKAAERRAQQDAAWDAHVETWPEEVKALAADAVERERQERKDRRWG